MTNPPWYTPAEPELGVNSPLALRERAKFFTELEQYGGRSLSLTTNQPEYRPPTQTFTPAQVPGLSDPALIGRAVYWGIPEESAKMIPKQQLIGILTDLETRYRQPDEGAMAAMRAGMGQLGLSGLMEFGQGFGLGAGQGLTKLFKNLPGVGEWFSKTDAIQSADQWLGKMEESLRMSTPEELQISLSIGQGVGNVAAMWYPAVGAWNLAGKAGALVPFAGRITSPIIRQAAQGGAAAWVLEGGSEHAGQAVGLGVAGGAVIPAAGRLVEHYAPAFQVAAHKVSKAFGGAWEKRVRPAGTPLGPDPAAGFNPGMEIPVDPAALSMQNQLLRVVSDPTMPEESRQSAQALLQELHGSHRSQIAVAVDVSRVELALLARNEADAMATQMTKQSLIVESSTLPEASQQILPDETTVARAVVIDNPGGTNVVPGIPDPARLIQALAPSGQHTRFVKGPNSSTLDAIISDEPITDAMAAQYEQLGMYQGQRALTSQGAEVRIKNFTQGSAWVEPLYGGEGRWVTLNHLMPSSTSPGVREVPHLWTGLQRYAAGRAQAANEAVGGTLTSERVLQMQDDNMPQYIEDFLDEAGIKTLSERARIKEYFNGRFVAEYKALAPEENARQAALAQQLSAAEAANPSTPLARLDAKAAAKGYVVVPDGTTGEWRMIDLHSISASASKPPTEISFQTQEAAEAWINKIHRELPDVSPPTNVPGEIAEALPTAGIHDPKTPDEDSLMRLQVESANSMAESLNAETPGLGDRLRADIEVAAQSGSLGQVQAAWEYGWAQAQPMRARFLEVERNLQSRGASFAELKPFQTIYDPVSTAQVKYHNNAYPELGRWAGIMAKFDRQDLRTGVVTQIWELTDPALRRSAAVAKKFSPEQVAALDEMEAFINEHGGKDAARKVAGYLSRLRVRQSLPLNQRDQYDMGVVDDIVKSFAEFAEGSLQLRELDARVLGNVLVRSIMFQRHLAPAWDVAHAAAKQISAVPGMEQLGKMADGWLQIVKKGYNPQPDQFLEFMHSALSALVPGMTRAQTRALVGTTMSVTHRALLGWRPDVWARDAMQLMLALPRVGADLLVAMKNYATAGSAERAAMMERGVEGGWVTRGMPRIASPGAFEDPMVYVEEGIAPVAQHVESRRYRTLQRAADLVHGVVPTSLRNPAGTPIDPLYVYTKQSERMRLLPGLAMAQRADREIAAFRSAGGAGLLDDLIGKTGARTFDVSIQQKFKELIAAGDDREASNFLARQVADATQFKYGLSENPEMARTLGGRMFMQMGNFSTQFYQYTRESLRNGSRTDKARFLAMMGATTLAFKIAKQATGWDFDKWQFYHSLSFTGGPWTRPIADAITGGGALSQMAFQEGGNQTGTGQYQQQQAGRLGNAVSGIANMVNPAAGGMRTAGGIRQALDSPNPLNALGRTLVTGERGNAQDYRELFEQTFGPMTPVPPIQQMTPMQDPVRGSGFGLPAPTAPPDTSFIPNTANPTPYQAAGYDPEMIMSAIAGTADQRRFFAQDELQVLDSLRGSDRETVLSVFSTYMADKLRKNPRITGAQF